MSSRRGFQPSRHSAKRGSLLGWLAFAATVVMVEVMSRGLHYVPNRFLFLAIPTVYVAYRNGLASGLAAAAIMLAFAIRDSAIPGSPLRFTLKEGSELIVVALSVPAIVAIVGILHARTERMAAELLRHERQYAATLVAAAQDGLILHDGDGNILEVNDRLLDMVGFSREELVGKPQPQAFWPPDQVDSLFEIKRCALAGDRGDFDAVLLRKNGERFPAIVTIGVVGEAGTPSSRCVATVKDVTMRRKAQALIRDRAEREAIVAELGLKGLQGLGLDELMNESVVRLVEVFQVEYAKVLEFLPEEQALRLRSGVGWKEGLVGVAKVAADVESQAGYTLKTNRPVIVTDFRAETRFASPLLLRDHGVSSGMSVIILGRVDPFGVLGIHSTRPRDFSEHDVRFFQSVANVLAAAIERDRIERELSASEARFRLALKNKGIVVAQQDMYLKYIWMFNSRADFDAETVVGRRNADLMPKEDADRLDAICRRVLETGVGERSLVSLTSEGRRRYFDALIEPSRDDRGAIVGCTGAALDITERIEAERQTRESHELLRAVVEGTTDAVYVKDDQGRYLMINTSGAKSIDRTVEEVIGRTDADLFDAETAKRIIDEDRRIMIEGTSRTYLGIVNGSRGESRAFSTFKAPWRDSEGKVVGLCGISRDVTEMRQTEEALRAAEELRGAMLETALDAVVAIDSQGRVIEWNPAAERMFGQKRDEALGKAIGDLIIPEGTREQCRLGLIRYDRTGESRMLGRRIETEALRSDGSTFPIEMAIMPIAREHTQVFTAYLRDISERKQAEESLKRYSGRLEMLHELDRAILAADSSEEIAGSAIERLGGLIPFWRSSVFIFEGRECRVLATAGAFSDSFPAGARFSMGVDFDAELDSLSRGIVSIVNDLSTEPIPPLEIEELRQSGLRSYYRIPMRHQGQLVGCLNVGFDEPSGFTPWQVEIAREVADQITIALRQSILFEEVRAAKERLEAISRRLIRAEEDERRRIARELHDETGQSLTAIKINLRSALRALDAPANARRLEESLGLVERTIDQVRGISLGLRPSLLDDFGLVPALRSLCAGLAERLGIAVDFRADPSIDRCEPELETACFRIAQEALTNIAKHANARAVQVELTRVGNRLRLVAADDGAGFDVAEATARASRGFSLGVLGIRERALLVGGDLTIGSTRGRGTRIVATFPLERSPSSLADHSAEFGP